MIRDIEIGILHNIHVYSIMLYFISFFIRSLYYCIPQYVISLFLYPCKLNLYVLYYCIFISINYFPVYYIYMNYITVYYIPVYNIPVYYIPVYYPRILYLCILYPCIFYPCLLYPCIFYPYPCIEYKIMWPLQSSTIHALLLVKYFLKLLRKENIWNKKNWSKS